MNCNFLAHRCFVSKARMYIPSTLLPFLLSDGLLWHQSGENLWTALPFSLPQSSVLNASLQSHFYFQCSVLIKNHIHNSIIPSADPKGEFIQEKINLLLKAHCLSNRYNRVTVSLGLCGSLYNN